MTASRDLLQPHRFYFPNRPQLVLDGNILSSYYRGVWEIEGTDEFSDWYASLPPDRRAQIDARVDELADKGPMLRRPIVGEISSSRIHNMKELRASSGPAQLRVLFVFDPARTAILLLGGNKAEGSAWNSWYSVAIPHAEDVYAEYLRETGQE